MSVKITLAVVLCAAAASAGTLSFVEPATSVVVEYGSELDIVVRNTTDSTAVVYLVGDGTDLVGDWADRELFTALPGDITTFVLDTSVIAPGVCLLEARSSVAPTAAVSVRVKSAAAESDMPKVYPLPNPFDLSTLEGKVEFVNVPAGSVVTIFDMRGLKVAELALAYTWNGRNERGDMVSSGTYLYHITSPGGSVFTGKLAVVK